MQDRIGMEIYKKGLKNNLILRPLGNIIYLYLANASHRDGIAYECSGVIGMSMYLDDCGISYRYSGIGHGSHAASHRIHVQVTPLEKKLGAVAILLLFGSS